MKLYETLDALDTVGAWIEEHADDILAAGGELSPELAELLDKAEGDFKTKAERVALKVRELQAEAEAVKIERDRLAQRAKAATNAADSLKAYLYRALLASGLQSVKGTLVTVALQKNPPKLVATREPDERDSTVYVEHIPAHYAWNNSVLKAAAKNGEPLPDGVTVVQEQSIRIR